LTKRSCGDSVLNFSPLSSLLSPQSSFLMHAALQSIAQATKGTPFEGNLWLVGGAVRDELLGRPEPNDFDIVTELSSGDLAQFLFDQGVSSLEPVTYARFGTALVRVAGANIELATARKESYAPDSRKPDVEPATLGQDARRRDFTVNALMRNLHSGELVDLLGNGLADLEARILHTPLDPATTFRDDPLRMLRAVRFVWTLRFAPAPGLYDAIRSECRRLDIVSAERIRDEFLKILALEEASEALEDLRATSLLKVFAPELDAMKGVEQGGYHHLDVWDHTRLAVRNAGTGDPILTLATLLHDVGKPETRSIDANGHTRFFQHESVGASMARELLNRLRLSQDVIEATALLVKNHMRLQTADSISASMARRLVRDLGAELDRLLCLVEADASALKPGVKVMDVRAIRRRIEEVQTATPAETLESPLTGSEIMELTGLEEGPEVGRIKAMLLEKVLEGELAPGDKERAKALLDG
jgi:poly(A) polymerase